MQNNSRNKPVGYLSFPASSCYGDFFRSDDIVNLIRRIARRAQSELDQYLETRRLAPLYSPDPANLDLEAHLSAALDWLKRAQDAGDDHGVSWGVRFSSDFEASYPETTGYICQTFTRMARRTGDRELLDRAMKMGDWEAEVQMPEGAVMGGKFNRNPTPAIFNTGMVLLGWSELIRATGEERYRQAARRAADWLVRMQNPDGNWSRGNSQFASGTATTYNVKAAWGLCEAGVALDREDYVRSALRNAEFCVTRQESNGWFRDCCLDDPAQPLLHTLAYTMQGLLEIGRLTGRRDLISAAQRTADAELAILASDGFLPGRQNAQMRGSVTWCCLTGSAQTSIVWRALHLMTGEEKYRNSADLINRYLLARHDVRNSDARLRGGLPGSWPVDGPYGRLRILNWSTKFLVDALAGQKDQTVRAGASTEIALQAAGTAAPPSARLH